MDLKAKVRADQWSPPREPHVAILSSERCTACESQACLHVCPTEVFVPRVKGEGIRVEHERCVECGACWLLCPENIVFRFPPGGEGIIHRYG